MEVYTFQAWPPWERETFPKKINKKCNHALTNDNQCNGLLVDYSSKVVLVNICIIVLSISVAAGSRLPLAAAAEQSDGAAAPRSTCGGVLVCV